MDIAARMFPRERFLPLMQSNQEIEKLFPEDQLQRIIANKKFALDKVNESI